MGRKKQTLPRKISKKIRRTIEIITEGLKSMHPAKLVLLGYFLYIAAGWILLNIPWMQEVRGVSPLDHLFISTSAVSTTGLVTVSISDTYNFLGQFVILLLIQLGGVGYMTFGSFVILSRKKDLDKKQSEISENVFSLPESFDMKSFLKGVVRFTLAAELIGAVALFFIFNSHGVENSVWSAVFHSVSAFCTAGFSLFNDSFQGFADNFWLNFVIAGLCYMGAIGFIVFIDYWRKFRRKTDAISLTSKIIIRATVLLGVSATLLIFLVEPGVQHLKPAERLLVSFFQSMTSMTTVGFNTIDISSMAKAVILIIIVLMVIGASPSGTGGGIKSTTFATVMGAIKSAISGKKRIEFFRNRIPTERVWTSVASLAFFIVFFVTGTFLLELTEGSSLVKNLFETASALGTVGLTMGATGELSTMGKIIVIILMYTGRLGPLTFGIAIFFKEGIFSKTRDKDIAVE